MSDSTKTLDSGEAGVRQQRGTKRKHSNTENSHLPRPHGAKRTRLNSTQANNEAIEDVKDDEHVEAEQVIKTEEETESHNEGMSVDESRDSEHAQLSEWLEASRCQLFEPYLLSKDINLKNLKNMDYELLKKVIMKLPDTDYDDLVKAKFLGAVKELQGKLVIHVMVTPEESSASLKLNEQRMILSNEVNRFTQALADIDDSKDASIAKVKKHVKCIKDGMTKREESLIAEINKNVKIKTDKFTEQLGTIQKSLQELNEIESKYQSNMRSECDNVAARQRQNVEMIEKALSEKIDLEFPCYPGIAAIFNEKKSSTFTSSHGVVTAYDIPPAPTLKVMNVTSRGCGVKVKCNSKCKVIGAEIYWKKKTANGKHGKVSKKGWTVGKCEVDKTGSGTAGLTLNPCTSYHIAVNLQSSNGFGPYGFCEVTTNTLDLTWDKEYSNSYATHKDNGAVQLKNTGQARMGYVIKDTEWESFEYAVILEEFNQGLYMRWQSSWDNSSYYGLYISKGSTSYTYYYPRSTSVSSSTCSTKDGKYLQNKDRFRVVMQFEWKTWVTVYHNQDVLKEFTMNYKDIHFGTLITSGNSYTVELSLEFLGAVPRSVESPRRRKRRRSNPNRFPGAEALPGADAFDCFELSEPSCDDSSSVSLP